MEEYVFARMTVRVGVYNMVSYKINMRLSGRMTQLPDSQKIFGALVYFYAEKTSSKKAGDFVAAVKEDSIFFSVSDMMPAGYVPAPQAYLLECAKPAFRKQEQISEKEIYREIKKRQFIKIEQLEQCLKNPIAIARKYPYVKICSSQRIHTAIDSLQYDLPGLDPNVYSLPEIQVVEIERAKQKDKEAMPFTKFEFYIRTTPNSAGSELVEFLREAQDEQRPFFLGPRASQGLNIFLVEEVNQESHETDRSANKYLNMGMLLPQRINLQESYIKLFTSQRRPYNKVEGWNKQEEKMFISFIQAGSVVEVSGELETAGKSISSPFEEKAIVFGNAYLLPVFSGGDKE